MTSASDPNQIRIGSTAIPPVTSVCDLCVHIDSNLTMRSHVVRLCFMALRQIRSVRRSLARHTLLTLVRALVVSKIDYCNSVPASISAHLLDRLQSVLNAAAWWSPGDLLGKDAGFHQPITLQTPLGSGDNSIPAVWSGISLPLWHSTIIPCQQPSLCRRCRLSSYLLLANSVAGRSINPPHNTWQLRLSHGCSQSVERATTNDHGLTVTAGIPPITQNFSF